MTCFGTVFFDKFCKKSTSFWTLSTTKSSKKGRVAGFKGYQMTWFWHSFFDKLCKEAQVSGQLLQKNTKR